MVLVGAWCVEVGVWWWVVVVVVEVVVMVVVVVVIVMELLCSGSLCEGRVGKRVLLYGVVVCRVSVC